MIITLDTEEKVNQWITRCERIVSGIESYREFKVKQAIERYKKSYTNCSFLYKIIFRVKELSDEQVLKLLKDDYDFRYIKCYYMDLMENCQLICIALAKCDAKSIKLDSDEYNDLVLFERKLDERFRNQVWS